MKSLRSFFDLIKFEHTVFALPFAYLGMLLAAQGWPTLHQFFWITAAMVAARTLAMGFNRIADLLAPTRFVYNIWLPFLCSFRTLCRSKNGAIALPLHAFTLLRGASRS